MRKIPPWLVAIGENDWSSRLTAFVAGQTYEACSVMWVRHAAAGHPGHVAFFSGVQAAMLVLGLGESIRGRWCAPFFVVGYAAGAYMAMLP
jgi:hypothetical protein